MTWIGRLIKKKEISQKTTMGDNTRGGRKRIMSETIEVNSAVMINITIDMIEAMTGIATKRETMGSTIEIVIMRQVIDYSVYVSI
jgi:hypothetical protein